MYNASPKVKRLLARERDEADAVGRDQRTVRLPAYAWPGGYQMFYLAADNAVLCPGCADDACKDPDEEMVIDFSINYEDEELECAECNGYIDASYGEREVPAEHSWVQTSTYYQNRGEPDDKGYYPEVSLDMVDIEYLEDRGVDEED